MQTTVKFARLVVTRLVCRQGVVLLRMWKAFVLQLPAKHTDRARHAEVSEIEWAVVKVAPNEARFRSWLPLL
jgi:hypothetical protein